jgi:DNA-binding CsgD family transcriptional regulator
MVGRRNIPRQVKCVTKTTVLMVERSKDELTELALTNLFQTAKIHQMLTVKSEIDIREIDVLLPTIVAIYGIDRDSFNATIDTLGQIKRSAPCPTAIGIYKNLNYDQRLILSQYCDLVCDRDNFSIRTVQEFLQKLEQSKYITIVRSPHFRAFTPQELSLCQYLGQLKDRAEICGLMTIRNRRFNTLISNLKTKLNVSSREAIVAYSIRSGLADNIQRNYHVK